LVNLSFSTTAIRVVFFSRGLQKTRSTLIPTSGIYTPPPASACGDLCISIVSPHPSLIPREEKGVSSSPPMEERIEVRRILNLFHVMQSSPGCKGGRAGKGCAAKTLILGKIFHQQRQGPTGEDVFQVQCRPVAVGRYRSGVVGEKIVKHCFPRKPTGKDDARVFPQ
jgi:hypothetical protein